MMRKFIRAFILIIATSNLCYPQEKAIDFTLVDTEGNQWNLFDELSKGKTVVLDFFFADCKPCQKWTPLLDSLYQGYGGDTGNVLVLGISDRDNNATLNSFKQTYNASYPSGGTEGGGADITDLYTTYFSFLGWPTYAIVCHDTSINWDIPPISDGLPEIVSVIDSCRNLLVGIYYPNKLIENINIINIYPIPSNHQINIELNMKVRDQVKIEVFTLFGQFIKTLLDKELSNNITLDLSLDGLRSGIYLLRISDNNSVIYNNKIVLLK